MKKYYIKVVFIILISILYIILGYSRSNAAKLNGWVTIGSKKYYYVNNIAVKGKYTVNENPRGTYYFSKKTGKMLSGWRTINGEKYYFTKNSGMVTGYKIINGKGYYFESNGTMVYSKKVKGIVYGSSGECLNLAKYKMAMKADTQTSKTNYLILVDYTTYNIALFKGYKGNWTLNAFSKCSYGRDTKVRLEPGEYTLGKRIQDNNGELYVNFKNNSKQQVSGYVYYTVPLFKNNISTGRYIHTTLYPKRQCVVPKSYDDKQLGKTNTNGCIRTNLDIAKSIYDVYQQGTKVYIFRS